MVTGGARSGKSAFAEALAVASRPPVWYVATAQAPDGSDPEMQVRIREHQARRPSDWVTVEASQEVGRRLQARSAQGVPPGTILLDDLGILTSNRLLALCGDADPTRETARQLDALLSRELGDLNAAQQAGGWGLIVVTQEVGLGIVPATPLGRVFRDALGRANQRLAARAGEVYLLMAGLPLKLKPPCEHLFETRPDGSR
ncbi:MAG: bifunctional adenosylcobinamide kinase/adenosylcobinamide-phosphate guanylyltransferase [Chloroflexota bacterium]